MSHRQSCDRCRQQKVRCLRNDDATGSPARCERCTKAGADCTYSLTSTAARRRSKNHSVQSTTPSSPESGTKYVGSASWFDPGLNAPLYVGGASLGTETPDLVNHFTNLEDNGSGAIFSCWDANVQPFPASPMNSLMALPMPDASFIPTAPSTAGSPNDSDDNELDTTESLSSQLASLSQRATRATRSLVQPNREPLTVSSSEVSEALEIVNTLVHIVHNITAPERENIALDATTTDYGLAFSALACHQHLVALFRAICDTIHQYVQTRKKEKNMAQQHMQQAKRAAHDMGPSVVAQFVMVLQLLMHLISRIDRSLFHKNSTASQYPSLFTNGQPSPITPDSIHQHTIDPRQIEEASRGSPTRGGLVFLVHDLVEELPKEHEKLRQVIQRLQLDLDLSSFL